MVGNLAVSARTLTVTAKAVTLVYGSAVPTFWDFTVTGFYASETWATLPSGAPICSSSYATNTHVGNSYVISCSGGNAGVNYSVVPVANTLRVTARPVKIIATAVTVTYGDTAVITSTNQAVSGFAESGLMVGDAFTYQPSCSVSLYTNKKDAGTYPNAINCSGAFNSDYDISYEPATLQIDQRSVVVTANLHSLTYGDAVPTYLYSTSNLLSGDSLGTITCSSSYTVSTPVSLSPLAITCSGAVNSNYAISYAANRTVTLAKQPVTVTYNGSIFYGVAAPSYQASVTGLRNGDALVPTPTCSSTYVQFAGVGSYPVTCDRGVVSENYSLSVIDGVLEVKKRVINLQSTLPTIGAVKKITYGDQAPEYGYSIAANSLILGEGFVNGESFESLQNVPSCTSSYVARADVRSYLVVCTVGVLENYTVVTSTDSFEVTPRSLTIQPLPMTISYGDVLQPFTPSVTGFLLGDGFSTAPICGLDSSSRPSVGTQPINCEVNGAVVRGQLKNYLVTFNTATLTVIKKLITVTANSFQNVLFYDNAPTYGFTAKGLESGDSITGNNVCTSTYFKGAVASLVAYETSCVIADQANYEITALPGTLLVGKKSVQIKSANPTLVYGDDASNTSPVITGVVSGFPLSAQPVCFIQGYSRVSPVGTYSVQCSLAEQQNYSIGYVVGSATVTKRDLELVAPSKNISYSSNLPLLKVDGFGFVNDDLLTVEPTCSVLEAPNKLYSTRTPVGSYVVRCSGAVNNNYLITYTDGTLTVDRKAITVKAPNLSVSVGSPPPVYVAKAVGLANGDTFDVQPNCSSTYSAQDPRGDYAVTCSGGSLTNYRISGYEPGLLLSRYSINTLDSLVIGGRNSLAGGSWNVPFGTKKVAVSYELTDPSSRASIGDLNLEVGVNVVRVTVTADDETQNEYLVTITVDEPSLVARPVSVKAGSSVVTLNGTSLSVPIIASSSNGSVSLSATGWGVSFIVASASGTVQPLDGTNLLATTGDSVAISLRGYLPHSIVNVYLMSDPVLLGSFEVDGSGSVLALVSLPQNIVFGAHSLQLNGVSDDGATVRSASIALTIKSLFVLQKALPFTATSAKLSASVSKAIASIAKAAKNGKGILVQVFATVQGKASAKDSKLAKNRAASMAAVIAAFKKAGLKAIYVPNTGTGAQTGSKSVKVQVSVSYKA